MYRSPEGIEKQIDYILLKRRHLIYNEDTDVNDTIHINSDHEYDMAIFRINIKKTNWSRDGNVK